MTKNCKPGRIVHELPHDPFPPPRKLVDHIRDREPAPEAPIPQRKQEPRTTVQPDLSAPLPHPIPEARTVEATTETPPPVVVASPPFIKPTETYMTPNQALSVKSDTQAAQTGTVAPDDAPYRPCCIDYTFAAIFVALVLAIAAIWVAYVVRRRK